MKTNQRRKPKAIYSKLAIRQSSQPLSLVLAETQKQAAFLWQKGKASDMPELEAVGLEAVGGPAGSDRLRVHMWLSVIGPKLEVRTKIREVVSD